MPTILAIAGFLSGFAYAVWEDQSLSADGFIPGLIGLGFVFGGGVAVCASTRSGCQLAIAFVLSFLTIAGLLSSIWRLRTTMSWPGFLENLSEPALWLALAPAMVLVPVHRLSARKPAGMAAYPVVLVVSGLPLSLYMEASAGSCLRFFASLGVGQALGMFLALKLSVILSRHA
jgi:hypothetical protein